MWSCECRDDGTFDVRLFGLRPTSVNKEDICLRCGNYAVWDNQNDMRKEGGTLLDKTVTVFKLKEGEFKYFTDLYEASIYAGYSSKHALPKKLKELDLWYSKALGSLALVGKHDEVPEEYLKYTRPKIVFAFSYKTGEMLAKGLLAQVAKELGEKETTIVSNLHRGSIKSKKGVVYSRRENFNVEGYKAAMEIPSDNDSMRWRQDVISYDDNELGVKFKEDTYGTWKDLLYS